MASAILERDRPPLVTRQLTRLRLSTFPWTPTPPSPTADQNLKDVPVLRSEKVKCIRLRDSRRVLQVHRPACSRRRQVNANANAAGDRARASREGEPAASSAPGRRQVDLEEDLFLSDSDEEEKKFHSGMRRMVTRAELHRAQHRRRHL